MLVLWSKSRSGRVKDEKKINLVLNGSKITATSWGMQFSDPDNFSEKPVDNCGKTVDKWGRLWKTSNICANLREKDSLMYPHIWGYVKSSTYIFKMAIFAANSCKHSR
jgi:hypothetical protein